MRSAVVVLRKAKPAPIGSWEMPPPEIRRAHAADCATIRSCPTKKRRDPGFLRGHFARLDDPIDQIDHKLDEVITRLGIVEYDVAGLRMNFAAMNLRLDNISGRLGRVERRLELADEHALTGEA